MARLAHIIIASVLAVMAMQAAVMASDTAPIHLPSPQQLSLTSGIAVFPWMVGGIGWSHAFFGLTPFKVVFGQDANLPEGQSVVVEPGTDGTTLTDGNTYIAVSPAAEARIDKGTAIVHTLKVKGVTYHYDRVISMMTTAYNASRAMNGPSGAVAAWNGQPLVNGDVAVDPSVIPLGTYLYVDGYGPARAVDTGSQVIGDHVDLFFNESAVKVALYGIQFHKVYVLTSPPKNFPT